MVRAFLSSVLLTATHAEWYDGIAGIQVLSPGDNLDWWGFYGSMRGAQWSEERHAILLKAGAYPDAQIGVGYYTSVMGVGATRNDVTVNSVYALDLNDDGSGGGATQNFWRSVEGLTTTADSNMWATSQACPVRRVNFEGSLRLSDKHATSWSSGGFIANTHIGGGLDCGSQQQFYFRNTEFDQGTQCGGLINGAFVGTLGEGQQDPTHVSSFGEVERMAEKPFLVEESGQWHIAVPNYQTYSRGIIDDTDLLEKIPMDQVHVAKDGDSAASINTAIQGKRALLLTPGFYALEGPIRVSDPNFVVLGIGYPTLVATGGSALIIEESATEARVAAILVDAGIPVGESVSPALVHWQGAGGVLSDMFARTGAFKYERGSKGSCMATRTDAMVQLDGDNLVVDNTWLWHADHDDCSPHWPDTLSDGCYTGYGLLVQGEDVSVHGLKVEHVYKDHVHWKGERGRMVFLQEELPYHQLDFGSNGNVGYRVADTVTTHTAYALGVYIVGVCGNMRNVTAISAPNTASLNNMVAWDNGADVSAFSAILCHAGNCSTGECYGDKCRLQKVPEPAPKYGDTVLISSQHSMKCLQLVGKSDSDGTLVETATCNEGNMYQHWMYVDGQIMHVTQDGRKLCLDDPQTTHPWRGDKLKVYTCSGSSLQQWTYDHLVGNVNLGTPGSTTFCMDLTDGGFEDGTPVQIWNCDKTGGFKNQKWHARTIEVGTVLSV